MNQNPSPHAGSHRARASRAMLNVLVATSLVLLGLAVSMPAASARTDGAGSAAAWPAQWTAYTYADGTAIGDLNGDVLPADLDLASVACAACVGPAPSVAFTSDGADAFFRIRVATDITDTLQHGSSGGAVLVQIADANGEVRAVVGVDGSNPADPGVYVADPLGAVVTTIEESPRRAGSPIRVIDAADGSAHFFLDFQVPLREIAKVSGGTVTQSTPVKLYAGSSAATALAPLSLATINADFMLGNVAAVDFAALATVRLAAPQYPVEFNSTGGSPVAAQLVTEGFRVAAPAPPTRTGYTFDGWYDAESAYDFSSAVTGPTTILARWSRNSYPVRFYSTGGSTVADQTVLHGDTVVEPTAPTLGDKTFLGWFSAARGGQAVDLATQPVTAPTALYAHWRDARPASRPGEVRPVRSAGRATVTAQSKRRTFEVVFYPNGGSAVASQSVAAGDTASVPNEPTRAGYAFKGWFATPDGGQKWDFSSPINEATTLYAYWRAVEEDSVDDRTRGTADVVADGDQVDTDTDSEQVSGGSDGPNDTAMTLPNTGNKVPVGVLPGAVTMLLVGFLLLGRDRRRLAGARHSQ